MEPLGYQADAFETSLDKLAQVGCIRGGFVVDPMGRLEIVIDIPRAVAVNDWLVAVSPLVLLYRAT